MTSRQKAMEALLKHPKFTEEVADRLKRFCRDLSEDQFEALVHAVSRCEFTEGLDWPEKEARRQFFDRMYPTG
jgi:hypothetical protein